MGFKDSLVKIIGLDNYEEDFVTEEELMASSRREERREEKRAQKEAKRERRKNEDLEATYVSTSTPRHSTVNAQVYGEGVANRTNAKRIMDERLSTGDTGSNSLKLILIEPKSFDECSKLVDSLKARKPIIINLENLERDVARKIFDFLNGATYALNGNVQKIANNIFIFTPANVNVAQDQSMTSGTDSELFNRWG